MAIDPSMVHAGMEVVDAHGHNLGTVKEVRDVDFLLDRSLAPDVYVSFDAIISTSGRIALNIPEEQVEEFSKRGDFPKI